MANLGYIQLSRICNQKCIFCSNPDNGRILSMEEAKAHVDDFVARDYEGIILTGGEPTLFEGLPELVRYANEKGIHSRMITNGQRTSDMEFLKPIVEAGLTHLHISTHSHKPEVHDWLTQHPGSLEHQIASIDNATELGIAINLNIVINHYNADHLDGLVGWITERFPAVNHIVFNCLDPLMRRTGAEDKVIPKLWEFEVSLAKALNHLSHCDLTFRVERLPLCYMADWAHCSTETRKIVKEEERLIHFLDQKETFHQTTFYHEKGEVCKSCTLDPICAGLYQMNNFYSESELSPLFIDPRPIVEYCLERKLDDKEYEKLMSRINAKKNNRQPGMP